MYDMRLHVRECEMDEHEDGGGPGGARRGASARGPRADGAVGAVGGRARQGTLDLSARVACEERLAICAESGDVSGARAMVLAREDARLCAAGRRCMCEGR